MNPAQVIVVIPVKPPAVAKSCLSGVLKPGPRTALARNLLWRVLKAVQGVAVHKTWVVGGDSTVERAAQAAGAIWMPEEGSDLNKVLEHAFQKALQEGKAPMYLPADLPFLQPTDIHGLIHSTGNLAQIALAPDRWGMGTNGILLTEDSPFRPALGPGSFQRHLAQVAFLGMGLAIYYSPGLSRDLDTPEDLGLFEAIAPGLTAELTGKPHFQERKETP
ncbi:MAG: hypothetical protein HW388_963 [Dehalococcoidia bacterium]|nr:hypothetical protein [Dehalococcoidia bacterium]